MNYCDDCMHKSVCGKSGVNHPSMNFCSEKLVSVSPGWISVDAELPDEDEEVLVDDPNFGYCVAKYTKVMDPSPKVGDETKGLYISTMQFLIHYSIDSADMATIYPTRWKRINF